MSNLQEQTAKEKYNGLRVENIHELVFSKLSESAKSQLSKKYDTTLGDDFVVKYIGVSGLTAEQERNCEKLAQFLEKTNSAFKILGRFGDFIRFDYYNLDPSTPPKAAFLAYVAMTHEAGSIVDLLLENNIKTNFFLPGACPIE